MESLDSVRRASRRLRLICSGLMWFLPVAGLVFWLGLNYGPDWCREGLRAQLPVAVRGQLPVWELVLGFAVMMVQLAVVIYGLATLSRLFGLYERGIIFESDNVVCLRRVGRAAIVWSVLLTFTNALIGVVVTLHNPPGQRLLALGVSSSQVVGLLGGAMLLILAWVMDEGRKMQAEQRLIV